MGAYFMPSGNIMPERKQTTTLHFDLNTYLKAHKEKRKVCEEYFGHSQQEIFRPGKSQPVFSRKDVTYLCSCKVKNYMFTITSL